MSAISLKHWPIKPVLLAGLVWICLVTAFAGTVQFVLARQVENSIKVDAEHKAKRWSQRFFKEVPNAKQMFESGAVAHADLMRLEDSFAMISILRFELFDPQGKRTYTSEPGGPVNHSAFDSRALDVYRNGSPMIFLLHGKQETQEGSAGTIVDAYVPAVTPSGDRVGTIKAHVDTRPLQATLEQAFRKISRVLIVGTTVLLAIPAVAYVCWSHRLRKKDRRLLELTRYDQLTGVLNRNSTSEILDAFFSSHDNSVPLGILFIDVDFFKRVNDQRGHAYGDSLLRHIAGLLSTSTRSSNDVVGRFGGDEFILLARDISPSDFRGLYARIMEKTAVPWEHEGTVFEVSLSIGAYLTRPGDTRATALHRADIAVYAAKRDGRGRVVEYSEELEGVFDEDRHTT